MSTAIRWTGETWNPITGCSKVSPGCANCYAEALSLRFGRSPAPWTPANAELNVELHPERLLKPLSWPAPRRVFVNSMSDLFHELAPAPYIADVFAVMAATPRHTYQVLTKRPERMLAVLTADDWPLELEGAWARLERSVAQLRRPPVLAGALPGHRFDPVANRLAVVLDNVWLGTSIENDRHTFRARILEGVPAHVRFVSAEPLLGPLPSLDLDRLDWLIVGGESGPGFRPMDADWARDLRDRALAAGVAFFYKQGANRYTERDTELDGERWEQYPDERAA